MALVKCEECGKEISDRASSCPHCGAPNPHFISDRPNEGEVFIPCSKHPDRKSMVKCNTCGAGMCNECSIGHIEFDDGSKMCVDCALKYYKNLRFDIFKSLTLSSLSLIWYLYFLGIALVKIVGTIGTPMSWQEQFMIFWYYFALAAFLPMLAAYLDNTTKSIFGTYLMIRSPISILIGAVIVFMICPVAGAFLMYKHIRILLDIKKNYPIIRDRIFQVTDIITARDTVRNQYNS